MLIVVRRSLFLGDHSEGDPPVPIPNTAVKPLSPDGTARASVWESRKSPGYIPSVKPPHRGGFFCSDRYIWTAKFICRSSATRGIVEARLVSFRETGRVSC